MRFESGDCATQPPNLYNETVMTEIELNMEIAGILGWTQVEHTKDGVGGPEGCADIGAVGYEPTPQRSRRCLRHRPPEGRGFCEGDGEERMSLKEIARHHIPNDHIAREGSREAERRRLAQQWVEHGVRIVTNEFGQGFISYEVDEREEP